MKIKSGNKKRKNQQGIDYIYRYEINTEAPNSVYSDPVIEVIKENLKAILEIVILTFDGKEVLVNGFKLLDDDEKNYPLFR